MLVFQYDFIKFIVHDWKELIVNSWLGFKAVDNQLGKLPLIVFRTYVPWEQKPTSNCPGYYTPA